MDKLLTYASKTDRGNHAYVIDSERTHLIKTASAYHPTIAAYINNAKSVPGRTQILLTALGAGEYWGFNSNGDFFGEDQLSIDSPDYGFRTFEIHSKLYKHHVNKDPKASYGDVVLTVYNPTYHRVELIVSVRHDNANDIVEHIESGENVNFSMGCKIPYDVCSICGNKAPNRKHYCEHLRYSLGQIDPETGRAVYAINIRPKFFDISYVLVPADKTAMMLKKVASVNMAQKITSSAELADKQAAAIKASEIDKRIPANDPPGSAGLISSENARNTARVLLAVKKREESLPPEVINKLCAMGPMSEVLSTMQACLIVPTPKEFQRIALIHMGKGKDADALDRINAVFDPLAPVQVREEHRQTIGVSPSRIRRDMLSVLQPYLEARSYSAPLLMRRMQGLQKSASVEKPPRYIDHNRSDSGIVPALGIGAALYGALVLANKYEVMRNLLGALSRHPTLAAGLGAGTYLGVRKAYDSMNQPRTYGRYNSAATLYPDTFDLYDRYERTSEKPYLKVSSDLASEGNRLLDGMPMCFMASTASQRQWFENAAEEEKAIIKIAQDLSTSPYFYPMFSDTTIGNGNGPRARIPTQELLKAAGIAEELTPGFSKSASFSECVSNTLLGVSHMQTVDRDRVIIDLGMKLV